jgi:hypothetical protein
MCVETFSPSIWNSSQPIVFFYILQMIIPSLNQWVTGEWIIFRVSEPSPPPINAFLYAPGFKLV